MKLGSEAFQRAATFIERHARPLDRRLFEYHFQDGPADAVLRELASYQNADGGFGRCLEPDFRLEQSSPMATSVGFQYLRAVGATASHPCVRAGIRYVLNTYDASLQRWQSVPPEINAVPRAPWWIYDEAQAATPGFRANPGAELVGYLHEYALLVPREFLSEATDLCLRHLDGSPIDMEMHDAACAARLLERLPEPHRSRALDKLRRVADEIVPRDPQAWKEYGVTPLLLAPSPESPLAGSFGDAMDANLDFLIASQTPEGCWTPNWSWGQFEDVWPVAEREWQGILMVNALRSLRDYDRL